MSEKEQLFEPNPSRPNWSAIGLLLLANLIALNVQTILSTLADNIYSSWIPLFLWEVHELKFERMGVYSALPLLGGAIAGAAHWWSRRSHSRWCCWQRRDC